MSSEENREDMFPTGFEMFDRVRIVNEICKNLFLSVIENFVVWYRTVLQKLTNILVEMNPKNKVLTKQPQTAQ